MKLNITLAFSRLRAAWGVITAERCVVVTYDPKKPVTNLGYIYVCAPSQEVPERLANATKIAYEWDKIDNEEGQQAILRKANDILACPRAYS